MRSTSPPPVEDGSPNFSEKLVSFNHFGRSVGGTQNNVCKFVFVSPSFLAWSNIPIPVPIFNTSTKDFSHATRVVKRYKPEAVAQIEDINQVVEYQTKKFCK